MSTGLCCVSHGSQIEPGMLGMTADCMAGHRHRMPSLPGSRSTHILLVFMAGTPGIVAAVDVH